MAPPEAGRRNPTVLVYSLPPFEHFDKTLETDK